MYNILGPDPGMMGSATPSSAPQASQMPGYLQQQNNPSIAGGVNNMVRALLGGYQQGQQQHNYLQALDQARRNTVGGAGGPLNINPPGQYSPAGTSTAPSYVPTWQQSWNPGSSSGGLW